MEDQPQPQQYSQMPPLQKALPNATAVLVLGIVSIVPGVCCYGIVGIVCGIIAFSLAKKDRVLYLNNPEEYTPASYSNLNAGRTCAIIGMILSGLIIIFWIFYVAIIGTAILSHPNAIFNH